MIWTGAALAWGTALVVARLEPARVLDNPVAGQTAESSHAAMPNPAPLGLVILRFTPVESPLPDVRTVVINRSAGNSTSAASQSAQAAPQPASSGS